MTHPTSPTARPRAPRPTGRAARIGTGAQDLRRRLRPARHGARRAVVVIVSDGWEIDDPALVGQAMQQLSRLAFHIIWVNPRKAAAGYQSLVGGMAAALPYVDTFVSGHSPRALGEVMEAIRDATDDGRHHAAARRSTSRHVTGALDPRAAGAGAPARPGARARGARDRGVHPQPTSSPTGRLVT